MRPQNLRSLFVCLATSAAARFVHIRDTSSLLASYDYVVIGGGTAGLTVADRLTESPSATVLVIEAGPLITGADRTFSETPGNSLTVVGYEWAQRYAWNITSVPSAKLNNRTFEVTARRAVGGASSLNGMVFDRGSKRDYDDWARFTGDASWGWDGLLPYFKKSETFTPAPEDVAQEFGVDYDPSAHGTSGPVHSSYPPFLWPIVKLYNAAFNSMGIPTPRDSTNGDALGSFFMPASVDPRTNTRSSARTAHHERAEPRDNYHLLTDHLVTRILFQNKKAIGVEYSLGEGQPVQKALVKKEVILSGGSIHSPRILQLSGIGDKRLLNRLEIPVVLDLPGVGNNLQDHSALASAFNFLNPPSPSQSDLLTNATFAAEALGEYQNNRTGPYTCIWGSNYLTFLTLPWVSSRHKQLISAASADRDDHDHLRPGIHPHVLAGYQKQKALLLDSFSTGEAAVAEIIDTLLLLQRPLSRGYVEIGSANPFEPPLVDYRAMTNNFDANVMLDSFRFMRKVFQQPALENLQIQEAVPGSNVTSDEDLLRFMYESGVLPTAAHPSSTCHAGKRELGAVVDTKFRVHGVQNLRVVDASVFPLVPATHLSSTVYALAEKAADEIKKTASS